MAPPSSPSKFRAPPDFEGPITDRKTTDILFLLLKIGSWAAMTAVAWIAWPLSNFWTVVMPVDYLGQICGQDTMSSLPSLQFTDLSGNGVCTTGCYTGPAITTNPAAWTQSDLTCRYGVTVGGGVTAANLVANSECMPKYESLNLLNRCIPTSYTTLNTYFDAASGTNFQGSVTDTMNTAERFASDVWTSAPVLFGCGLGISFVLSFLFLLILRIPKFAAVITWVSLLTIPLLIGGIGVFCFTSYQDYKNNNNSTTNPETTWQITAFQVSAYVCWAISAIMLLFAIAVRKRVNLAVKCTKATARAVCAIPIMVLYPLLQLVGFLAYLAIWVFYLCTVVGMGELTDGVVDIGGVQVTYSYYKYTDNAKYSFWFLLFELYWTAQFIIGLGSITLSLGFAKWYFTVEKSTVSSSSFFQSNWVAMRYHQGTAAFGSLIIAIVQIVRSIFAYINARVEAMERADPTSSFMPYRTCARIARACCFCCLWCLEKLIKFVNKNAYVQTAIFGTSFCTSAKNAFGLIARNILRIMAMSFVSTLTFVLTKLWVILGTATCTFFALQHFYETTLYSIYGICVLAGILAWFVADMFTDVMEIGVTTILQCYLADEEILGGIGEYCPSELKNFFDGIHQDSKEMRSDQEGAVRKKGTDDSDDENIEVHKTPPKRGMKSTSVVTH